MLLSSGGLRSPALTESGLDDYRVCNARLILDGNQFSHQCDQFVGEERVERAIVDPPRPACHHLDVPEARLF